jgi:hypothetical protein
VSYWIFIVTNREFGGQQFTADEVLRQRAEDKFWGLGDRTPNRGNLAPNDQVIFYLGNPVKSFAGSATLATTAFQLTEKEQEEFSHGTEFYRPPYGVKLTDVQIWADRKPVVELLGNLDFVENQEFWFTYFQGGIRSDQSKRFSSHNGSWDSTTAPRRIDWGF